MSAFTMTLTPEQREALQLAIIAANSEWDRRAKVLVSSGLPMLATMATEIRQRMEVLDSLRAILYRLPEFPDSDVAPYSDIDEGKEPKYESPESIHGVGATF